MASGGSMLLNLKNRLRKGPGINIQNIYGYKTIFGSKIPSAKEEE